MATNDAAAPSDDCPGLRIHVIDMVHPPGIGISPIADMAMLQTIVVAALTVKTSAETARKARRGAPARLMPRETSRRAPPPQHPPISSALVILVVTAPPDV